MRSLRASGMLRRCVAPVPVRTSIAFAATRPVLSCQRLSLERHISFLPWRKKPPSDLPVFFPKIAAQPRPKAFRRRLGRVVFTTLVLYMCWQIFATVVFDPLLDWADEEWEQMSEKEKDEMERLADEDEPILFLPFPFTTKEVKQPPYKGTDPEWEMFLTVNKDKKLQKDIKLGLAEVIRRGVEANPAYVMLLGGKNIKVQKLWLDIIYPPVPPPKHYVSGLIIDEDGLFWGDRPIDSAAVSNLNLAIYPKAVALTAWTFVSVLFGQTAQDIGRALGMGNAPASETTWQSVTLDRIEQGNMGYSVKQSKVQGVPGRPTLNLPSLQNDIFGTTDQDSQMHPRIQAATKAATVTFAKNWQPAKPPPDRGCIRVDGLVELQGKAAIMAVYVLGWYDPKERKYTSIETGLKHLIQLKQKPAGG